MMQGHESGVDWSGYAVLTGITAIIIAWVKKADPRLLLVWLNEPTMRPLHEKLDRVCKVIDHIPGSKEAHEAVKAEEERWKQ